MPTTDLRSSSNSGHNDDDSTYTSVMDAVQDEPVTLDPNSPFEAALIKLVQRKRFDFAPNGDPWYHYRHTAGMLGVGPLDIALYDLASELARLAALRNSNGQLQHSGISGDTHFNLAMTSVIALGIYSYPNGRVER